MMQHFQTIPLRIQKNNCVFLCPVLIHKIMKEKEARSVEHQPGDKKKGKWKRVSPVSSMTRMRANRSGYSANTFPVSGIDMASLKKPEIFFSTRLSKVELQALATLAVPVKQNGTYITDSRCILILWNVKSPCFQRKHLIQDQAHLSTSVITTNWSKSCTCILNHLLGVVLESKKHDIEF